MKKLLFVALFFTLPVNAALLELNSGDFSHTNISPGTEGYDRGISFQALSDFSISSIGIYGDLLISQSFDVEIYSSTDGHQAGGLLASASSTLGGTGTGWHDIGINFAFDLNSFYVLNWAPTADTNAWGEIELYRDSALPVTVGGLAMLIDGVGSNFPGVLDFDNRLHPNLRIDASVIPLPAAVWLFGTALIGLVGLSKRRKAA